MTVTFTVPEDLRPRLQASWGNLSRRALEALAVEAYRDGVLSSADVGRLLGHTSRVETEVFLSERSAHLHYCAEDIVRDVATLRRTQQT